MRKTKTEILAEEKQIEAELKRKQEFQKAYKDIQEAKHLARKARPYKEICYECKNCFFNEEKDEWDCKSPWHDLLENSCGNFEEEE